MTYKHCAICGKPLNTIKFNVYFCNVCYKLWEQDILAKKEWVRFVTNNELRDRRRTLADSRVLVYLGLSTDVSEDGTLVLIEDG